MRHHTIALLALAAATPRAPAAPLVQQSPTITNLRIDGRVLRGPSPDGDGFVLISVPEGNQGGGDLNGDGDVLDRVWHVLPADSTVPINTGLAVDFTSAFVAGTRAVVLVPEVKQSQDLNGDGDLLDDVAHVHDVTTETTTNLGLACVDLRAGRGSALLAVGESIQGTTDLNGDADTFDVVVHHVNLASGAVQNLGLAIDHGSSVYELDANNGDELLWAFEVDEFDQGADLNGDGLFESQVPATYEPLTDTLTVESDPSLFMVSAAHGRVCLARRESIHGKDLNGDGDQRDDVFEIIEPSTGTRIRTSLGATPLFGSTLSHMFAVQLFPSHATIAVNERSHGVDLTGDGALGEPVLQVVDLATGEVLNTGLHHTAQVAIDGSRLFHSTWEGAVPSTDFNGDGDAFDTVPVVWDLGSFTPSLLDFAGAIGATTATHCNVVLFENHQGDTDLNGDGDAVDYIWHTYEYASGELTNHRIRSVHNGAQLGNAEGAGPDFLAFIGREPVVPPTDLNGDGDPWDPVLHVYDTKSGLLTSTGLASYNLDARLGRRLFVRVDEELQGGTDLNGDGDTLDQVLHVVEVP